MALWGAIGTALGTIIHNQVGAVITLLAWGFVVDNLLFGLVPSVGPLHADTRVGRADGPEDPASALARRRRDHPDRLGDRAGGHRHRPDRPARHQLTRGRNRSAHRLIGDRGVLNSIWMSLQHPVASDKDRRSRFDEFAQRASLFRELSDFLHVLRRVGACVLSGYVVGASAGYEQRLDRR